MKEKFLISFLPETTLTPGHLFFKKGARQFPRTLCSSYGPRPGTKNRLCEDILSDLIKKCYYISEKTKIFIFVNFKFPETPLYQISTSSTEERCHFENNAAANLKSFTLIFWKLSWKCHYNSTLTLEYTIFS